MLRSHTALCFAQVVNTDNRPHNPPTKLGRTALLIAHHTKIKEIIAAFVFPWHNGISIRGDILAYKNNAGNEALITDLEHFHKSETQTLTAACRLGDSFLSIAGLQSAVFKHSLRAQLDDC